MEQTIYLKPFLLTTVGTVGAFVAGLFGGWDMALQTLLLFMVVDIITGLMVATVWKNSPKTSTGTLSSNSGWKGLSKKGVMLLFVLIAVRLDMMTGTDYIRTGTCIAFTANELISITENAGLMGIPVPAFIVNAIDTLKQKKV